MKKLVATSLFTVALTLGLCGHCAAQSKTTDFSGAWTLDKTKTSDLPPTLESYTMTITQDAQQLTVETDVQGEIGGNLVAKASWKKSGKILELQSTRQLKTPDGNERSVASKDRWELSNDGKTLTIKRAVETPRGTHEVKLLFIKQ